MHEVRVGEKGQVTVPKTIRDHYHLAKGDQVRMIDLGNGIMEVVLLKHSRELSPPVIKTNKTATVGKLKKTASKAAVARFKRGKMA